MRPRLHGGCDSYEGMYDELRARATRTAPALLSVVREAVLRARISKPGSGHSLRHSFATDLLEPGDDIRTIHALLGHRDASKTMICTHVLNRGGRGVIGPVDRR